jgi:imidazolonepropionase-like amidohydrolase
MIANGITGARVMWGRSFNLAQRAEIESGRLLGPRLVISTPIFDGRMWKGSIEATSPDEVRRMVRAFAAEGYDFVKTYQFLPRDIYLAIADEGRRLRIPVTGHVPMAVSLVEALDAGQRSIEHGVGLGLACSREELRLRAELTAAAAKLPAYSFAEHGTMMLNAEAQPLAAFDAAKCAAVAERIRNSGTWLVPTLTLYRGLGAAAGSPVREDPRLKYLPDAIRKRFASSPPSAGAEALRVEMGRLTTTMVRAGVGVLAGTDTPNPYVLPGFGLHDELALLVEAGLTPLQALQAATLNPARFLNRADSLGTIAAGKLADLLLLDANPLDEIRNTQKINAVIIDGRVLGRGQLDALLTSAGQRSALP